MKVHRIDTKLLIPIPLEEAWQFFANPDNLSQITPDEMAMKNVFPLDAPAIYPGMLIVHEVTPIPLVKMTWVTEITHVERHKRFVDEQRKGPFAMWHHIHEFEPHVKGTEVRDLLYYGLPFGVIGSIAGRLKLHKQIASVFDHREKALKSIFG